MRKITLICTVHREIGKCNSEELHKILELVAPDVIFEELPNDLFDRFYNKNDIPYEPPEVKSIKRYLEKHNIEHIPVDIDTSADLSFDSIEHIFGAFLKFAVYYELEDKHWLSASQNGFAYLNSKKCSELIDRKNFTEQYLLAAGIDSTETLLPMYKLFHKEQEKRENAILHNIYNYSKDNQYNQAVFLLGVAHRNSIMKKIQQYEKVSTLNLNWTFYHDDLVKQTI